MLNVLLLQLPVPRLDGELRAKDIGQLSTEAIASAGDFLFFVVIVARSKKLPYKFKRGSTYQK